jgi:crossover junction endodeoxyribonuclease RusA
MSESLLLNLPWPPTVNHYWGQRGKSRFVKREGLLFRVAVLAEFRRVRHRGFGLSRLRVDIVACPPDKRRRDLDNLGKAVCDAMGHAGAYADDSQIDDFRIHRGPLKKGGGLIVELWEM